MDMMNQPLCHTPNQPKRNINSSVYKNHSIPTTNGSHANSIHLPAGWKREECIRQNGLSTGRTEVFYISPSGQKIRTKQELHTLLGDSIDLSNFDWRSGKFVSSTRAFRVDEAGDAKIPRLDECANPLTRRVPFPTTYEPVIIRSHPECKRTEVKYPQYETAHQLFWEKRFTNAVVVDPDTGEALKPMNLPKSIKNAGIPGFESAHIIQSLISALSTKETPVTGQEQSPSAIEKNPCIAVNPLQPMIKTFIVSDDDVRRQEARVRELRRKLQVTRKKIDSLCTSG